jgi:hypothetical protein
MQYQDYETNPLEKPMATEPEDPEYTILVNQTPRQEPQQIFPSSKRSCETLVRIYCLCHGFEALDGLMVQHLSFLAFMAHGAIQIAHRRPNYRLCDQLS